MTKHSLKTNSSATTRHSATTETKAQRADWHRLDNIGNYYAAELGRSIQTVFRFSASMADPIDPVALQEAVNKAVKEFPNFNVCLRSGFFWHYLQEVNTPLVVTPETDPICARLHFGAKSPLVRVSYFRNRINFELSHMVSDGRGSLNFFKELLQQYVMATHTDVTIPPALESSPEQKSEDSFSKYYERVAGHATKLKSGYQIPGLKMPEDPTFMEFHLPVTDVLKISKGMNVTLTSLIIAVLIRSIRQEMSTSQVGKIIRIGVPIDLRRAFKSETTRNFFGLAFVSHTTLPVPDEPSIELLAREVQEQLKEAEKPENLKPRMMQMVSFEKNRFIQLSPVFVKDKVVRFFDWLTSHDVTATVSNVGAISLNEALVPFVNEINILTGTRGLNFVVTSCRDDLSIGISTIFTNLDIVCHFVRFFTDRSVAAFINSSRAELTEAEGTLMVTPPEELPSEKPSHEEPPAVHAQLKEPSAGAPAADAPREEAPHA